MKALQIDLIETFPFNPENCVPYDGVSMHSIYKPLETDIEAFKTELQESIDEGEFGLASFNIVGEVEIPDELILFEGEYLTPEDAEHEEMLREIGWYDEAFKDQEEQMAAGYPDGI